MGLNPIVALIVAITMGVLLFFAFVQIGQLILPQPSNVSQQDFLQKMSLVVIVLVGILVGTIIAKKNVYLSLVVFLINIVILIVELLIG